MAESADRTKIPYKAVLKTQKKWERPGDPDSWRREYDLYRSNIATVFSDSFRWPECYHAEVNNDEIQLWLEYIDGKSGDNLTTEMLEMAALELGRFQGKTHKQPEPLQNLGCFGDTGYLKRDYTQWHSGSYTYEFCCSDEFRVPEHVKQMIIRNPWDNDKTLEYNYLRFDECTIPEHLKQMIFNIDDHMNGVFQEIESLPVILCHRDFWIENILYLDGKIRLIDWDTAGWGYMGEDIASLIADNDDYTNFEECCRRLIPSYLKGIAEYMDVSSVHNGYIHEMILIKFGYRLVQTHMFTTSDEVKERQLKMLQKIFDMG